MNQVNPKRARKAVGWLSLLTPAAAVLSVINVTIAISTSVWLKTTEQIFVDSSNSSVLRSEVPRTKRTISGLWKLCEYHNLTQANGTVTNCFAIDYFAKERYTPEPHDSTMAIPYTVTKAGPFFFAASSLLVCGILSAVLGYVWRHKRVAIFIAGILFIIAGLVMLIGMVVYLSVLQAEVGQKLRPRNSVDKPPFSYSYGYSFILIVVGFMSTEMTGTCAIFWYIYWHQLDWAEKAGSHNHHNHHHHHHGHHGHHQHGHHHHQSGRQSSSSGSHGRHHHSHQSRQSRRQQSCESQDESCCKDHRCHGIDGRGYFDRSGSSGEDAGFDSVAGGRPHYHRHRSASHSGGQSSILDSTSSNYYTYNKLYPCKKHGTIPPRYNTRRSHNRQTQFFGYAGAPGHGLESSSASYAAQQGNNDRVLYNMKCIKCSTLTPPPPSTIANHHHHHHPFCNGYYDDDDLLLDLDLPLPPPPPIPRDITCTTTVSDDFFMDHHQNNSVVNQPPLPTNTPNASRDRNTPRDHRKTTPV